MTTTFRIRITKDGSLERAAHEIMQELGGDSTAAPDADQRVIEVMMVLEEVGNGTN